MAELNFDAKTDGSWFSKRLEAFDEGKWPLFARPESWQQLLNFDHPSLPPKRSQVISLRDIEGVFGCAEQFLMNSTWSDPFDYDLNLGAPPEAWYVVLLILEARAGRNDTEAAAAAKIVSYYLDNLEWGERHYRPLGGVLLKDYLKSADIKLVLSDAHLLVRRALASKRSYGTSYRGTPRGPSLEEILGDAQLLPLLAATALVFSHRLIPHGMMLAKFFAGELQNRAKR